jgi:hypothetical protein
LTKTVLLVTQLKVVVSVKKHKDVCLELNQDQEEVLVKTGE